MPQPFVHLHLHSEFSLVDSTLRLKQLVERAKELGYPEMDNLARIYKEKKPTVKP